jgi:hypothetical protein
MVYPIDVREPNAGRAEVCDPGVHRGEEIETVVHDEREYVAAHEQSRPRITPPARNPGPRAVDDLPCECWYG